MKKVISILCLLLLVMGSCNNCKELNAADYIRFFEKQDEHSKIRTSNMDYVLQLVTPECIAAREVLQREKDFDLSAFRKRMKEIGDNTYVFIRLYDNAGNGISKDQLISYYQQYAQKQMKLIVDGGVGQSPEYINYEDSYGLAPYNTVVVCFSHPLKEVKNQLQFIYDDALSGNSNIRMSYSKPELDALPKLKI